MKFLIESVLKIINHQKRFLYNFDLSLFLLICLLPVKSVPLALFSVLSSGLQVNFSHIFCSMIKILKVDFYDFFDLVNWRSFGGVVEAERLN